LPESDVVEEAVVGDVEDPNLKQHADRVQLCTLAEPAGPKIRH
jgi:hypothetical protein